MPRVGDHPGGAVPEPQPILVAAGSDRVRRVVMGRNALDLAGVNDARKLLRASGLGYELFVATPNYLKKPRRFSPGDYGLLFNLVSDADINPKVLGVLQRVIERGDVAVVNDPASVLASTRERVAQRLQGLAGLSVPRTLRLHRRDPKRVAALVCGASFRFPGILRPAGTHGGLGAQITRNLDDLLRRLPQHREWYLTEFADYRSADGYYRKYRCFCIGRHIVFRHLIVSQGWSLHARERERFMLRHARFVREEEAIHDAGAAYFSPAQRETMHRIRVRLGLDYFGIDFAVRDSGQLVLFEANATMNFFPFTSQHAAHYSRQCLPRAVAAIRDLVADRLGSGRGPSDKAALPRSPG